MVGLHSPKRMALFVSLGCVLLGCVVNIVVPQDLAPRNTVGWRPSIRTSPPVRQPNGFPSLAESSPWPWVDVSQLRVLSSLNPVTVQCGEMQMVVTVNRDLFGTGRFVQPTNLTLGSAGCQPTSSDASKDTVIFDVGLHGCGSTLQVTPDSVVYAISLYYHPNLGSNPVIFRTRPVEVPIECHYPRKDNVNSKAIKPTWVSFSSTLSEEHRLAFSLRLMNDDWSAERASSSFQLGDVIHVQADVNAKDNMPLRLFIDSCIATLSSAKDSRSQYAVIDYNGCLIDGNLPGSSSAFLAPRPQENSLRFTLDVFRFATDPRDLLREKLLQVYLTCRLKVTAADQDPEPSNKACSFNKTSNTWSPVEGPSSICNCCETKDCESLGDQLARKAAGRLFQRDVSAQHGNSPKTEAEVDLVLGPIFIPGSQKSLESPLEHQTKLGAFIYDALHRAGIEVMLWITVGSSLVALVAVVLGFVIVCKKPVILPLDASTSLTIL